uniref:Uncharacterized protein n=1 Tax=Strix occidentalis caurina TaxID=311401 RepID=A0A8D0FSJ1_STROC
WKCSRPAIQLDFLSFSQFLADMENNALFRDDIECQKLIMEAMKYHLLPERRPMLQSPRTKPRKSTVGVLFAVGGMDATKGSCEIWNKSRNEWKCSLGARRREELEQPASRVPWAALELQSQMPKLCLKLPIYSAEGPRKLCLVQTTLTYFFFFLLCRLYAVGGRDGSSCLKSKLSFRYDPKTDMWTSVASMSISRDAVGVCLLGDKLYAVGGYDGQTYLNTVESYDPQTNEWTQV